VNVVPWLVACALFVSSDVSAGEPTPLSVCGSGADVGILTQDIDCSTYQGPAPILVIERALYLNGHTIVGNTDFALGDFDLENTIMCIGTCKIYGPGMILGSSRGAIAAVPDYRYSVQLENVTIDSATVIPGAVGVRGRKVRMTGSSVRHHGTGVRAGMKAMINDSTIAENYWSGIETAAARLDGATITGNGQLGVEDSIAARRSIIVDSTITGNRRGGVSNAGGITIKTSTIENNCEAPYCDIFFDLVTCEEPRLIDSQCGSSRDCAMPSTAWGVCALD
jgi:hypothetical protein